MENDRNALLAAILETAVDAIIVIDTGGIIEDMNPATSKMFGFARDELIGTNVSRLMPSPYREQHDGYLQQYLRTRQAKIIGKGRVVVARRQDGSTFPAHLAVSEFSAGSGTMFAGVVRDISDLEAARDELTRLNETLEQRVQVRTRQLREAQAELVKKEKLATLGQVSGSIAHEIRNPLNAIKTSAYYLLHAKSPTPAKTQEHLERIDRQVTLIDNVTTALSDVSRMLEPNLRTYDIRPIVREATGSVQLGDLIEVQNQIPENLPHVLVDENQIPMVFRNLIRNARDAMPDGGTLTLSCALHGDELTIHISDTGSGIDEEDLVRITEPLYSTKARGMGLGLAITKAILDKHGGELDIKSEVGVGSTFSVRLRVANAKEGAAADE